MGKKKTRKQELPNVMDEFGDLMKDMVRTKLEDARMVNTISATALTYVLSDFPKFIEWAKSIGMTEFEGKEDGLQQDVATAYMMVRGAVDLATEGLKELGEDPLDDPNVIKFPPNLGM